MTRPRPIRLAMPVVAVYWLLVASGLGLFVASRAAGDPLTARVCGAAIAGTLLGQCLALGDVRTRFTVLVIACVAATLPTRFDGISAWEVFVPAALCGYASLGHRGALAACWFPAVLWLLAILDWTGGQATPDGAGALLLGGFAVLFVVILRVRESRRVGLWRTVAAVPLATGKPVELLRQSPGLAIARAGWGISIAAITVVLTAWTAPRLWRLEAVRGQAVGIAVAREVATLAPRGVPCCPVDAVGARVREYLELGRSEARGVQLRAGLSCRVCDFVVVGAAGGPPVAIAHDPVAPRAVEAAGSAGSWQPPAAAATTAPQAVPVPAARSQLEPAPSPTPTAASTGAPLASAPAPGGRPAAVAPVSSTPTTGAEPSAGSTRGPADTAAPAPDAPAAPGGALRWLIALATAAISAPIAGLALRPLRRWLALRHLRRPLWDETVDQRISNSWRLALVGLRDAGWRFDASEPPHALARRVGIDSLERCATILERARHGLGIDAEDLTAMAAAAETAYRAARTGLGTATRATAWLRWPLT